jgi:UDP-N-acetylglucosamine enolpyruvyl transferase
MPNITDSVSVWVRAVREPPLHEHFVNTLHNPICFTEDFQNPLVVFDVIEVQRPTFAVFEPFLCRLVAADVEVPGDCGGVVEVLLGVDPDFAVGI